MAEHVDQRLAMLDDERRLGLRPSAARRQHSARRPRPALPVGSVTRDDLVVDAAGCRGSLLSTSRLPSLVGRLAAWNPPAPGARSGSCECRGRVQDHLDPSASAARSSFRAGRSRRRRGAEDVTRLRPRSAGSGPVAPPGRTCLLVLAARELRAPVSRLAAGSSRVVDRAARGPPGARRSSAARRLGRAGSVPRRTRRRRTRSSRARRAWRRHRRRGSFPAATDRARRLSRGACSACGRRVGRSRRSPRGPRAR